MTRPRVADSARAARLRPPALPSTHVPRRLLLRRLDEAFGRRLTVIVAGAGFGKSTLLAEWCTDVVCAWYGVSSREESLAHGLGAALRPWLPDRVAALLTASSPGPAGAAQAEELAGLLCEALERTLEHDLVLVLDDLQELAPASPAARLVESLCRQAPPLLHLVLASRAAPPFPIERLRGRGDVLELTSGDLAFTPEEAAVLVGDGSEFGLRLHAATGGWPAAVRLAVEAARATDEAGREAVLARLARPEGPLFAYLVEEVLGQETTAARELLRRLAAFDRVSPDLCHALGLPGGAPVLADLARRGLAVAEGEGWFSAHTLVRRFLSQAWPLSAEEQADAQTRAATWFEEHGLYEEAVRALAGAGDREAIARLLSEHGAALLSSSGAEAVVRAGQLAAGVPFDERAEEVLGEACALRGELESALSHLTLAGGRDRPLPASLAWRLAAAYHLRDDLSEAIDVLGRTGLGDADPADEALLLAWTASAHRRLGNEREARELSGRALAAAERSGDDRALALAHTSLGLLGDSPEPHLHLALAAAERAGDVFQCARIHNNLGSILLEAGSYEQAVEELSVAIELAELGSFTTLLAIATMNRGLCRWCLGRLDDASADYEAAAALYRRIGSREVAYALVGLGDVHRERGDVAQARADYEEALELAEASGDRQALVPALYQLAKVLVDEEPDRARALVDRAIDYGWPDLPWALNARGWILLAGGDRAGAAESSARAAEAARTKADPWGLAEALELQGLAATDPETSRHALGEALAAWRRLGNPLHETAVELALARATGDTEPAGSATLPEGRLRALGVRLSPTGPAGILREVARAAPASIAIETLGGFRLLRMGRPVPASEWRSQKARDLLKILIARRGRPVTREALMEALWPEDDPAQLGNRLSVALSTVRSVIDPERAHEPGRYVRSDTRTVTLDLSAVDVDIESFLAEAADGLALRASRRTGSAQDRLEHAFSLYRGDFLEEDAYADWAIGLREEARVLYGEIVHALADAASEAGRPDETARYCLRILEHERLDERAHLQLVASLASAGRHGEARRAYRRYVAEMEEIGVEPAPFPSAV